MAVNLKRLNGGSDPDKRVLTMNEMIVDPADIDLDEVGNPIDYFNIYKRKLQELAHQKFERGLDIMFFNYLDRLVDPKQFEEADRARAKLKGKEVNNLKEFVTEKTSLT